MPGIHRLCEHWREIFQGNVPDTLLGTGKAKYCASLNKSKLNYFLLQFRPVAAQSYKSLQPQ